MVFDVEMILRLLLAAILGGVVGAERESRNSSAGLRTHSLVSTSSALLMIISTYGFMEAISPGRIVLDPSRMAAQVISGIGFLGAGIIIFRKNTVRGLTTAASIWAVAAIGLAVGSGLYIVAIGATAILSIILTTLKKVEKRFFPQRNINTLVVEFKTGTFNAISDQLKKEGIKVLGMNVRTNRGINILKVDINAEDKAIGQLFQEMRLIKGVDSVSYRGRILSVDDWVSEEAEESEEDMPIVSE